MKYIISCVLFCFNIYAQQTNIVDFLEVNATITPHLETQTIEGEVTVNFKILAITDSVYLDAKRFTITQFNSNTINHKVQENHLVFHHKFKKDSIYKVNFSYTTTPKQAIYFFEDQIWTQGQGKYTSHWLPSIDDMNDKIIFDLSVIAPKEYTVIANGKLLNKASLSINNTIWHYDMQQPMSSYLVAFVMGNFIEKTQLTASKVPIYLYLEEKDTLFFEPTYRYTNQIFNFYEKTIGFAYPWQNYKQVPVRDFLYAGMENTSCTIFSNSFVVDNTGFIDRNYVSVNAHEMAHQWFGNLITETESTHHWLHEGFATYFALLAEKEIFGEDYFYWKLYNSAEQLKELSDQGLGEALLNPKATSLTYYEKGAWALHILRELIGEEPFFNSIKSFLNTYQFKNVTTTHLIEEIKKHTSQDISLWEKNWLQQSAFQSNEAYNSLKNSNFMTRYFEIAALKGTPISEKKGTLLKALENNNDYIGQEVIYQLANENTHEILSIWKTAFKTENLLVRQAIATALQEVHLSLKSEYETLLYDNSYLTQELALLHLWQSFAEDQPKYLEIFKEANGFKDKNLRQLYLTLALATPNYKPENNAEFLNELIAYSSKNYSYQIRQKAMEYLTALSINNTEYITHLINACTHSYWRFRNVARNLLQLKLENTKNKEWILTNFNRFSEKEKQYLKGIIN